MTVLRHVAGHQRMPGLCCYQIPAHLPCKCFEIYGRRHPICEKAFSEVCCRPSVWPLKCLSCHAQEPLLGGQDSLLYCSSTPTVIPCPSFICRRRTVVACATSVEAPAASRRHGEASGAPDRSHETEVVVIGSGLGGLCCAAMLATYGVKVFLSHTAAKGPAARLLLWHCHAPVSWPPQAGH